jgi:cell wall assembly regulator SMI1
MLDKREMELLQSLRLKPGASREVIEKALARIGGTLPGDYLEVIERADGGDGFVGGNSFLELWPIEEIPEVMSANEVNRSAPGLVPFASDGGGNVYAFDRRSPSMGIVEVSLIGISCGDARPAASSIGSLLTRLAESS